MSEERLDRIEAILEATATRLDVVAQQQQANTQAIAQLTNRVDQLTVDVDSLIEAVSGAFAEMRDDRQAFQTEIRRIWEYLLGQQPGNGRGET